MKGKLEKNDLGWIITNNNIIIEVDASDYKYLNDMWDGEIVEFTTITTTVVTNEFDTVNKNMAKITFEANLFQSIQDNNFIVSSYYRNDKDIFNDVYKTLSKDKSDEYNQYLKQFLVDLKNNSYNISKN